MEEIDICLDTCKGRGIEANGRRVREGRERNSNTDRWIRVGRKKEVRREGGDNR